MVLSSPPAHEPIALWVVPVPDLGGVARHVLDAAAVGIPGWRMVTLCPSGALAQRLGAQGAAVLTPPFGPAVGLRSSASALRRVIDRLRPAVVHSHLAFADFAAAVGTVGQPVRLVSSEHGIAADDLVYHGNPVRSRVMAVAHQARIGRFDALIAVAQATADAMHAKWGRRLAISVVLNGIDPPVRPVRAPGLRIASVSRLAPEKRIDRLLDAFALLRTAHPKASLTIAGSGPLDAELRAQSARLGPAGIHFAGFVDGAELLAESDVLAQLSHWENCSYTLLDALSAGVGVVATGVGGNPEILPPRCLVDADDTAAVAAALEVQGLHLDARPRLRAGWPSRSDMTAAIADVYRGLRHG